MVACARGRSGRSSDQRCIGGPERLDQRILSDRKQTDKGGFGKSRLSCTLGFGACRRRNGNFRYNAAQCVCISKEALGQSGSGSVLSNQRAWAELLSAEDVETKHRQTSEEEQSVDVTTGSKEYTNIMEVFPAQELVLEDGTLCISVTDKQLLYLDAGRSADEIFVSVNGEPVEIPEKTRWRVHIG